MWKDVAGMWSFWTALWWPAAAAVQTMMLAGSMFQADSSTRNLQHVAWAGAPDWKVWRVAGSNVIHINNTNQRPSMLAPARDGGNALVNNVVPFDRHPPRRAGAA